MTTDPNSVITGDQPITEAVRLILADLLITMREHEASYRAGDVAEGIHKMRVALRRMRTLVRLYGDRFEKKALKPIVKGMRKTGRVMGSVRDLDVLIENLRHHQKSLPKHEKAQMEGLIAHWQVRQLAARAELDAYLDGGKYQKFIDNLIAFTSHPGLGVVDYGDAVVPTQVRHILGSAILTRYEAAWAYAPILDVADDTTLHQLRIQCKFLRYSLEFFKDVLGESKIKPLVAPVVKLQDHLGDLHDASVAREILEQGGDSEDEARESYLQSRESKIETLKLGIPELWDKFDSERYRRNMASMLAAT